MEYYWADCLDEFEVRKRLWSRLTINQINVFKININANGIKEDEAEDVIDPFYIEQVEYIPILELDWSKREEDDLMSCTSKVLKRTEKWLKSKNFESTTLEFPKKHSKLKHKKA